MIKVLLSAVAALIVTATTTAAGAAPCVETATVDLSTPATGSTSLQLTLSRLPEGTGAFTISGKTNGVVVTAPFESSGESTVRTLIVPNGDHYDIGYTGPQMVVGPGKAGQRACWSGLDGKVVLVATGAVPDGAAEATVVVRISISPIKDPIAFLSTTTESAEVDAKERAAIAAAVPEVVVEALKLLAEIAVDKAKAEAMRMFKDKLVRRVCVELTQTVVWTGAPSSPLFPTTCGQLENLRLGDLGGSGKALLAAVRDDIAVVILPRVATQLGVSADPLMARLLVLLVTRAASAQFTNDELRLALVGFVQDVALTKVDNATVEGSLRRQLLRAVVEVAALCIAQNCTAGTVVRELQSRTTGPALVAAVTREYGGTLPGSVDQTHLNDLIAVAVEHRAELTAAVMRVRAIITPESGERPRQRAANAAAVILDLIELLRCKDAACRTEINQARDLVLGAVEGDYLRSLGGLTAILRASAVAPSHRKAIGLLTSIMSYIDTFRATSGDKPEVAREQRKRALEALIESGTDRTGREAQWVISLGASVGFQVGYRYLPYARADGANAADESGSLSHDLRLPLGVTALRLGKEGHSWSVFGHLGLADLALFVASDADELTPELHWSDFVEVSVQLGGAYGRHTPVVFGLDAGYAPGLRYVSASSDATTSSAGGRGVFRIGGFVGVNVPFFDLN